MAQEHTNQDAERELRAAFYEDIKAGKLSIAGAVATMRRISRLTPGDFARHRGIDVDTLEQIECTIGSYLRSLRTSWQSVSTRLCHDPLP